MITARNNKIPQRHRNNYSIVSNTAEQRCKLVEPMSRRIFLAYYFHRWFPFPIRRVARIGLFRAVPAWTGLKTSSWLSRCLRGAEWFFVAAGSSPRYAAKSRAFPIKETLPFFSRPSVSLFLPALLPPSKWLDTLFAGTCVFARQACRWCFFRREVNFGILLEFRIPCFFAFQQPFVSIVRECCAI